MSQATAETQVSRRAVEVLRNARGFVRANGGNRRNYADALRIMRPCCAPELYLFVLWFSIHGGVRTLTDANWEAYRGGFDMENPVYPEALK